MQWGVFLQMPPKCTTFRRTVLGEGPDSAVHLLDQLPLPHLSNSYPDMANVAGQSFLASSSLDQTSQAELLLQSKALEELLSVLLSAGYFRARVASLSAFDKVVGGLCWCITSSGIAVDVDIFYDEELALGQKMYVAACCMKKKERGWGLPTRICLYLDIFPSCLARTLIYFLFLCHGFISS